MAAPRAPHEDDGVTGGDPGDARPDALGILDPALTHVGFGIHRARGGFIQTAAGLDVLVGNTGGDRLIAGRHFGVGCDQILQVEARKARR